VLALLVLTVVCAQAQQGQGRRTANSNGNRQYPGNSEVGDAYFSIDPETRRVVTIADEDTSRYISQVISNLDRPKPQVLIKVVFLEVVHNDASDIGIEGGWGKQVNNDPTDMATVSGFGLSGLTSPATNLNRFGMPFSSFTPDSPMTAQGAGIYQVLGKDYQVTLRAIAQAGRAKVLSKPSIMARNNQPATITVGQSVPIISSVNYNTFGNAYNSISYRDVGVILSVTPFITSDGMVEMIVQPQISSVSDSQFVPLGEGVNYPLIDIRSADTVVVTPNAQTVVIGGLMQTTKAENDTKIPVLGDIPLLGVLFKRRQKAEVQKELVIFLTPHIVQAPTELAALSGRERAKSSLDAEFSEDELHKFLDSLPAKEPTPMTVPENSRPQKKRK
jgi:general secretion pathway protein D